MAKSTIVPGLLACLCFAQPIVSFRELPNSGRHITVFVSSQKQRPPRSNKIRLSGAVKSQDSETFTVVDSSNHDRVVRKTSNTRYIKKEQIRGGKKMAPANVLRGLYVDVIGVPGPNAEVIAEVVSFTDLDYRVASTVESRATLLEERASLAESRISQAEENSQRVSGQLDELSAVSNSARGGTKAAQETANAAVAGVNQTNERVSALDDYKIMKVVTIAFAARSEVLTEQAKAQLNDLGAELAKVKGYVVEVAGFGDGTGTSDENISISQQRADNIARYLARNGLVSVRRLLLPIGYGTIPSSAQSLTGRAEVRVLINTGLEQPAPTIIPRPAPH